MHTCDILTGLELVKHVPLEREQKEESRKMFNVILVLEEHE